MPADPAEGFLDLFRKSELFDSAGYARHFPSPADLPADPRDCAASLVQAGLLTAYQAKQLLLGKHKGFVLGSTRSSSRSARVAPALSSSPSTPP